ncbi:hypothetical protein Vqi01_52940 [Micromonospora qiuiae]|uniref:DUF222 domain-containing protein n=1 Tax=Micromonospora qiuiae TaxID=502268 RepID=A0ABQ4JKQ5_9ACTN|nr:hypothetical protein [Micromonospora qiuiae]GIJ30132.1 hypothetical protein Vqi01_52940 [Micromonospora qiuiae]
MADLERGIYESLNTGRLTNTLQHVDPNVVQEAKFESAEAHNLLARHIAALARRALLAAPDGTDRLIRQVELANRIAEGIAYADPLTLTSEDQVVDAKHILYAIAAPPIPPAAPTFPPRPTTPLSTGALLVNGRHQPRIGHEVAHEMASADQVDLLCAFIKWHGLRLIEPAIRDLVRRCWTVCPRFASTNATDGARRTSRCWCCWPSRASPTLDRVPANPSGTTAANSYR